MSVVERPPINNRRLAAAARALKAEQIRQGGPLFASHVAATQPTPRQRLERVDTAIEVGVVELRSRHAADWRAARAILRSFAPRQRDLVVHIWNSSFYPATADWFFRFVSDKAKEVLLETR